ncbi:MAG: phosphoglycerate kinase [Thermoplasmata archaeon]|nr:MAG: phosphoglycerate kinase [Thermoplasmata archaeon]
MKEYNTLDDFNLENKTILLRVDFNMPLDKKTLDILDTTRIKQALPTIKELTQKKAKTVILAHQGRPGSWDFTSLQKHAQALEKILGKKVEFINDIFGEKAKNAIKKLQPGQIILLDNIRKFPGETEKKSAEEHAKSELVQNLYPLADIFVNDAFAAAHRPQCSLIGFTAVLPSCAGRLMEKELTTLDKIIKNPEKPSTFLFGGAKFSDTITTIQHLLKNNTADNIILTGLPANAFLKAKGIKLGEKNEKTLKEEGTPEQFKKIKEILDEYKENIHLPIDLAIDKNNKRQEIDIIKLPTKYSIYDIGTKTIEKFKKILSNSKTIFLSGPCGVFEKPSFMKGTKEIFTFIANSKAYTIAGGGHTIAAIKQMKIENKISHISTGGGSLEKFMMGEKLSVVEALRKAKQTLMIQQK